MNKKMIETIVNLLIDLPNDKATFIIDYITSLKDSGSSQVSDGVREALDLDSRRRVIEAGP